MLIITPPAISLSIVANCLEWLCCSSLSHFHTSSTSDLFTWCPEGYIRCQSWRKFKMLSEDGGMCSTALHSVLPWEGCLILSCLAFRCCPICLRKYSYWLTLPSFPNGTKSRTILLRVHVFKLDSVCCALQKLLLIPSLWVFLGILLCFPPKSVLLSLGLCVPFQLQTLVQILSNHF